jgi:hypothetical protein
MIRHGAMMSWRDLGWRYHGVLAKHQTKTPRRSRVKRSLFYVLRFMKDIPFYYSPICSAVIFHFLHELRAFSRFNRPHARVPFHSSSARTHEIPHLEPFNQVKSKPNGYRTRFIRGTNDRAASWKRDLFPFGTDTHPGLCVSHDRRHWLEAISASS